MPTLYTALRTHVAKPKKRKKRLFRLSLKQRFKRIHPLSKPKRVIVIGAGFAGLAAAYELNSVGYDVTVVEGRGDVGGRVNSLDKFSPGLVAEGGAELIGSNHHAWLSYRHAFNLHFSDVLDPPNSPVILGGWRLSHREAQVLQKELKQATGKLNGAARHVNEDKPWKSPGARGLDRLSLKDAVERMPGVSALCKLALIEQLVADNGVPAADQSYLGVLAMIKGGGGKEYWEDTEVFRCIGGNQKLAWSLAASLPKSSVRCHHRVKEIHVTRRARDGVKVIFWEGKPETGDDVILTIPPSVWPDVKIKPHLPRKYRGQFGKNVKYLMNVRKNSWMPISPSLSTDGPVDLTWQATDHQPGPRAVLVGFSGSKNALICSNAKNRKGFYLAELTPVYPRIGKGIGRCKFMNWPKNQWTHGSYSFPAPGEVTRTGPLLRKPFNGRLHFAGEHTCYAFVGYMEGALQSGLRIAEQLARRDKII